jgi:hypothetical protein
VGVAITELTSESELAWEDFACRHPAGLLYYSLRYRNLVATVTGGLPRYFMALDREDGRVRGLMPTMEAPGEFGAAVNALPFYGSHGAPLAADSEAHRALVTHWNTLAGRGGVAAATLIENPFDETVLEGVAGDALDSRISQATPLSSADAGSDHLLGRFEASAARNVRKAASLGVTVCEEPDALGELADVHRDNMAAIGGLPKPATFFDAVPQCFRAGDDYQVWTARLDQTLIAGLLVFLFNGTVEYFTPVVREVDRSSQGLAAILARAMSGYAAQGFSRWNWGGTWTSQDGVYRFKKKWGATERPYRYWVVVDPALLKRTAAELRTAYPFFYVAPFGLLEGKE